MDDRQKTVLKKFEKEPVVFNIPEFKERDFADREFTLALAKLYPFYTEEFDFELFTKPYVKELMESAKIYLSTRAIEGVYKTMEEYREDYDAFDKMLTEKVATRAAMQEKVSKVKKTLSQQETKRSK